MTRPLSNDLRKRVVKAVLGGESCRSVASRFFILERIRQTPHLTLHGLKDELASRGVHVSHNAVWLFLRREGLRFKKTLFALEQARADVARRRRRWRSWQGRFDPQRLVFIDETWIKTSMAPLRGWGPKGDRLRGFAPHGHWQTLTFLGALRCDQLTAPCVFDGPINGSSRLPTCAPACGGHQGSEEVTEVTKTICALFRIRKLMSIERTARDVTDAIDRYDRGLNGSKPLDHQALAIDLGGSFLGREEFRAGPRASIGAAKLPQRASRNGIGKCAGERAQAVLQFTLGQR
jgi:transposase